MNFIVGNSSVNTWSPAAWVISNTTTTRELLCGFQIDIVFGNNISILSVFLRREINISEVYEMTVVFQGQVISTSSNGQILLEKISYRTIFNYNTNETDHNYYVEVNFQVQNPNGNSEILSWKTNSDTMDFKVGVKLKINKLFKRMNNVEILTFKPFLKCSHASPKLCNINLH